MVNASLKFTNPERYKRERKKATENMKKWIKKNPERAKESFRKYFQKKIKNDPVKYAKFKKRIAENHRKRLERDPEFRKKFKRKMREYNRQYRKRLKEKDPEKYRRIFNNRATHMMRPFVFGLKCKCGFDIKTNTAGRLSKRIIQCPNCRMYWYKCELEKVKIPRDMRIDLSYGLIENKNLTGNKKCRVCGSKKHNLKKAVDGKWERKLIHTENCPLTKSLKELGVET
jgi:hypothetical protein